MQANNPQALADALRAYNGPPLRVMEVCGTHTHENYRHGIRNILPEGIRLIAGPGCPVCVTPSGFVDEAVFLALQNGVTVCSFGDLLRVPGTEMSLSQARAAGGDVRIVYSPLDAVELAREHPDREVVFLSVGFETTTPASCLAVQRAAKLNLKNFSILCACKTMPNAYYALAGSADAFLYPGHVSAVTGTGIYETLKNEGISGAVAGFTAGELLTALTVIVEKHRQGTPFFVNCYPRVVTPEGNEKAMRLISEVMEKCDARWRGIGEIRGSGLRLRPEYAGFDAKTRFSVPDFPDAPERGCRCGDVLRGELEPPQCPLFGKGCTPVHPVGACMVSGEGACAAAYKYAIR